MKISIIIPIYNSEMYLKECLDSIKKQTYPNYEVLMINDGSTDSSEMICNAYLDDDRFIYYKKSNGGVSSARNYGIDRVTGDYICFVDSDDIVSKDYLSDFVKYNSPNNFVCCDLTNNINDLCKGEEVEEYNSKKKFNIIYQKCSGFMCNRIFNSKIINLYKIKFKEDIFMCEDLVFNIEYMSYIDNIIYLKKNNYYYRELSTSLSRTLKNEKWFTITEAILFLLKRYDKFDIYTKRKTIYFCKTVIIEYNYRLKYLKKQIDSKRVNKIKSIINSKKEKMFIKDYIKIIMYRFFTTLVFKYKYKN